MREERPRRLAWEGTLNARDLGGYPTASGVMTRWGAFVRCDCMTPLTEAGRRAVVDHGVRTIVDLRFPEEVTAHPNPFAESDGHGVRYTNLSLVDPAVAPSPFTTLADDYSRMLDRFRGQVGRIIATIADADEGVVLFHCMAGKDRTGVIAALLLDLVGVPRDIIGADYALTDGIRRPSDEEWLAHGPGTRAEREAQYERGRPRAEVMEEVLARLDQRYGDVERYLLGAGVTTEQIARLRRRLVDQA